MNAVIAFGAEAVVIAAVIAVLLWIAERNKQETAPDDPERQETTQYSSMQDD